ncbi:redoxin domain-containing protein [Pseudaminobacter sp. 19-2017]|uniref:Redoxin domain-containing protein n=1 Tax=Pseudaminobacter soli (ex Zhang et al. 2022) TaxID=2831468 RepID=A0A942DXF0_9HYPH|nr:redoxin domain-containing protein [Pseudaminobacter soli]MBS3649078.1 redoxin domain-containing protein [Pseudaminobacter soli]
MDLNNVLLAVTLAAAVSAPIPGHAAGTEAPQPPPATWLRVPFLHGLFGGPADSQSELTSLDRANAWINSPPLTASDLRGKVVLVDFWTLTCVNWRRTLPYVRAWADKYRDKGLVVIGVHSPEFEFEKNVDNVRTAVKEMGIDYPVAVDSDQLVWNGFDNEAWPALYFIDAEGRLRHSYLGEGAYEQSEMVIQALLKEAGADGFDRAPVMVDPEGPEVAADWRDLMSPESYVGYAKAENFASAGGTITDKPAIYDLPSHLRLNGWGLSGDWTVRKDAGRLNKPDGTIAYRFHARDLNLVMGPAASGAPVRYRVLIDGKPPGPAHGTDVDERGVGSAGEQRLYQLVRQPLPIGDRDFEIEFLDPGVEVFAFTFG